MYSDSDSDSDGSHISATPPREPPPTRPPPPPPRREPPPKSPAPRPPLAHTTFLSTIKSKTKTTAKTSTFSRTIIRPKPPTKHSKPPAKPDPQPSPADPKPDPPQPGPIALHNLPYRIHAPQQYTRETAPDALVPSLHLSFSSRSFAKTPNKNLNFEADDSIDGKSEAFDKKELMNEVTDREDSVKNVKKHINLIGGNLISSVPECASQGELFKENLRIGEAVNKVNDCKDSGKNVRKHINLIGGSVCSDLPAKKPKCGGEGNFVKLNVNGYMRKKFTFKSKRKGCNAYSGKRRFSRSSRKKTNAGGKEGDDSSNCLDEEGLISEMEARNEERSDFDGEMIEKAVMRVRNEASDKNLVELLSLTHGYDSFRNCQLDAIKNMLSGKSTMLVLPTGAGKSLCYQLPALVLPGITLVVSPLVALMIDQLKQLPPAIPGGLLCSSQSWDEASEILRSVQEGKIKVLFVSPERFLNAEFISIFSGTSLVSLVVVDEAHCVSEWSHNFRPSYMRLRASLLYEKLNAGSILAMTATATERTLNDVMHALEIPLTNLIQSAPLRNNLRLSLSRSGNRMKDLITLLKSSPFAEIKSIIIYCKFQSETDMISKYLCDYNILAKSYHGGIPAKDRNRIQNMFCSNKIRVVVATVAFGMGLDKRDIGAVIHYALPESLEEYVQEIGRAGRDGRLSYCHLFVDDATYFKLRSLMYSDGTDEYAVNKLLGQVFTSKRISADECYSLVKEAVSRKVDMKEEVVLTILTQLELGEMQYLHLLPQINTTCTLNFHQTSPGLLAAKDAVIAAILKKSERKDGQYVFDVPSVANSIRMQPLNLTNYLQSLKLKGEITYELKDPAICYKILNLPKDICSLAAQITKWLSEVEICKVRKLDAMFNAAAFAVKVCDKVHGCQENDHTPCLQKKILEYFNGNDGANVPNQMEDNSRFLRADIKVFLQSNSQAKFTPRAIARILHGLASPAYPSATWSRTHFWGRYAQVDFNVVMEAAKAELMNFVGKDVI